MKALKCKHSAQFAYNNTINVLIKCSNIISHRSSVFEGRHNDHRSSKVGTSIIHLRKSTHRSDLRHIYHRSSKVDTSIVELRKSTHRSDLRRSTHRSSIFEGRPIDLRRSKAETSHRQPNIAPTFRQFVTENCPQRRSIVIPKIPSCTQTLDEGTHAHTRVYTYTATAPHVHYSYVLYAYLYCVICASRRGN